LERRKVTVIGVLGRSRQPLKYDASGDLSLIFHHQNAASAYFGHFLHSLAPKLYIGPPRMYRGREADSHTELVIVSSQTCLSRF